ncbi:tetratricopeptide (TPR) repeat protein [Rhodovulum iodosum]|uniref:Tetratricopeptide (TPR) repeat protein n=1 Tax=Rhodovulum iodosum TaxID=68291 RepID=A0ABV3XRB1_9RHOB
MPAFRRPRPLAALALTAALAAALPVKAQEAGLAGAYLAARQASMTSDYREAATYYARALAADPANPRLMENALTAFVGLGDVASAIPVARRLQSAGQDNQIAHMVLLADQVERGAFAQAIDDIEAGRSAGPLLDGLMLAWGHLGLGRMSEALEAFDAAAETDWLKSFGLYHKALALAMVGDFEGADAIFSGEAGGQVQATRRGVIAHAAILSQLERNEDAIAAIDAVFGPDADPGIVDLRRRLAEGETLRFDMIETPREGAAEVFYTLASALSGDAVDSYTLIYSRLAEYLAPDNTDAMLMSAALLESQRQYVLASETYSRVPEDDPAYYAAVLGQAEALRESGDADAAIEVLRALAETHPDIAVVHVTLGDTLRRLERFEEARQAYDNAIALLGEPERRQWIVYYARGIVNERIDRWEAAEADFRKALELEPDQPQVLNYLGYSYVEMQTNLDEALDMIERAVEARPNDGYITDSLGWVLYRLGRYREAVPQMERAAELEPVDPIVNDHLGDVYWAVGRQLEARFQWRRALSFDPEKDEAERIRRKLEVGLDAVLEEEGAPPLEPLNDG